MGNSGTFWGECLRFLGLRTASSERTASAPVGSPRRDVQSGSAQGQAFRRRCLSWASAPSGASAESEQAKVAFARSLTAADLRDVTAEVAAWLPSDPDFRKLSLMAFVFAGLMQQIGRGAELASAIASTVTPEGPSLLIDMWGEARQPESTLQLLAAVDWRRADAELQIALSGAFLTVDALDAIAALREMKQHPRSAEAGREIDLALQNLERSAHAKSSSQRAADPNE